MKSLNFKQSGVLSLPHNTANIFSVLIGSLFIAVLAQISIPIPFSPVPITGQTIGVVLLGGLLGSKIASLAVLAYLFEGAMGLPVFANMQSGPHILIGPTGGYLWGFVIAAFLTGYITEKGLTNTPISSFLTCLFSTTLILIIGTGYLALFGLGLEKALIAGFYPFLIGDVIKSSICAMIIAYSRKSI